MIYICADDYGISPATDQRIEMCAREGALNKISILPHMIPSVWVNRPVDSSVEISLHLNLVEGKPLATDGKGMPVSKDGCFKYSFMGLLMMSLSPKRKVLEEQVYHELCMQLRSWKKHTDAPVSLDSHQHTHMIPMVFRALMRAVRDEKVEMKFLRIPAEPLLPYLKEPSLYLTYNPVNLIKQWLLKLLAWLNRKEIKNAQIPTAAFMGILFSGKMDKKRIEKVLAHYKAKDIELVFHPGYIAPGEKIPDTTRKSFLKFYLSKNRKVEYDTLMQCDL